MDKSNNHAAQIAAMLVEHLPPDGVLLDVGGNVGKVSACVKRSRPDVTIHLFEPVVPFAERAAKRLADFSGIYINAVGLSDAPGEAAIYTDPKNIGWSTLDVHFATGEKVRHSVTLMRLDDYPLSRIDVIKLDAEYWEGKVLKGGRRTIDRHHPVILTELSRGSEDLWYERVGEMERLFDIGYRRINYRVTGRKDVLLIPETRALRSASQSREGEQK